MKQKGFAGIIILIIALILAGLAGAYYFGKSQTPNLQPQNPVVVSQTPQPMLSPSASPDETANWKTYKSAQLNLNFKYPLNYDIKEQTYGSPDKPLFGVDLIDENTIMNLAGYATGRGAEGVIQTNDVMVGGNPAKEYTFGSSSDQITSIQISVNNINNGGKDITIFFNSKDNKPIPQEKLNTFDQILSTFKFTN